MRMIDCLGSPDSEGEKELVIDLSGIPEEMNEGDEVNKIKNQVLSELIQEDNGVWS